MLTIFLYFTTVMTVKGFLDNANGGISDTTVESRLQTVMEEMLKLQRDVATLTKEVGRSNNMERPQYRCEIMCMDTREQLDTSHILNVKATLKAKDENVAFLAYLTNDIVNPSVGQTLIFSKIEVNDGSAYDSAHGVFVALVSGTYHFAFLASVPEGKSHKIHIFMKKNGKNEMYIFFDFNTQFWFQRGASQVLRLTRGDRIWMEVGSVLGSGTIAGYSPSEDAYLAHFSGFLIHAD